MAVCLLSQTGDLHTSAGRTVYGLYRQIAVTLPGTSQPCCIKKEGGYQPRNG